LPRITGIVQTSPKRSRCLNWVIGVTLTVRRSLPVFPNKRIIQEPVGMSQTRQQPTRRVLADHPHLTLTGLYNVLEE
jgi:hypothetical protein